MKANDSPAESPAPAAPWRPWQPFTFRGVARFAGTALWRIWLMELVVAAVVALAVARFIQTDFAPVILQAVQQMPDGARIQNGRLAGIPETLLSETKLMAIAVTPDESTDIGQISDMQLQFRQDNYRIGSVFLPDWGMEFNYGPGNTDVSRAALEPLWGAWHPVIFAACGLAVMIGLAISWALLALVYSAPAKIAAWFADRKLSWPGAWKLSSAALMPGAALMILALALYGYQEIDLIGLGCFFAGHFLVGWIYIACAIRFLDRTLPPPAKNPFMPSA